MNINYRSPGALEETRFEKIHSVIFDDSRNASLVIAQEISSLIRNKQEKNKNCVLGLATGSSPISVYQELVRMHKEEGLSFKNVVTFNLDEYYPMSKEDINSYHYFMNIHLFDHIDIKKENIHIPDGTVKKEDINAYCDEYEKRILNEGGLDFQLLGIGRTGHIGFNEPGSNYGSLTRLVHLDYLTRNDARKSFLELKMSQQQQLRWVLGQLENQKE